MRSCRFVQSVHAIGAGLQSPLLRAALLATFAAALLATPRPTRAISQSPPDTVAVGARFELDLVLTQLLLEWQVPVERRTNHLGEVRYETQTLSRGQFEQAQEFCARVESAQGEVDRALAVASQDSRRFVFVGARIQGLYNSDLEQFEWSIPMLRPHSIMVKLLGRGIDPRRPPRRERGDPPRTREDAWAARSALAGSFWCPNWDIRMAYAVPAEAAPELDARVRAGELWANVIVRISGGDSIRDRQVESMRERVEKALERARDGRPESVPIMVSPGVEYLAVELTDKNGVVARLWPFAGDVGR